ncbi:MAG: UDP-N-acetylmuramoyl-L-alanine--D-glutamate ligase [Nitrospira sp. SB0672_bin_25]|nr:UDP-N-acetylmuramoyl-L-alanine--D-glutamate ligase [Nitrospira sp. SB0666_bin_27]MYF24326.1 UDP-N-acetylmuramoyl-L-alanine--D-glutamate ligase [Nitrospira sp. SB0678_bin_10]MYJ53351.1 UDP-N-acetylmuramoyl-L-alanine--D-glutamate ligase [Nitrospira sp. SB0672_bin_25]
MPVTMEKMSRRTHRTNPRPRTPDLAGQSVAVVGAGKSGVAAARLLVALGAKVALVDHKPETEWAMEASDVRSIHPFGGERFAQGLDGVALVVVSPGVPPVLDAFDAVRRQGVPIIGEVELASRFLSVPIIAVTGTNGKSTVVSLIGALLRECGTTPFVGGNLGTPLTEAALAMHQRAGLGTEESAPFQEIVAELSSFQLETIDRFHPHVAVLLNITTDHLDRHASFADYAKAKANIFRNQTAGDFAVLNADEAEVLSVRDSLCGQLVEFSVFKEVPHGVWVDGDRIMTRWKGQQDEVMPVCDIPLQGTHNVSNVLAALAVGLLRKCSPEGMRRAVRSFRGLPHVCEVVRERRGVTFINDSKGTNVDATLKAIDSLRQPFVIILGGQEKGSTEFGRLKAALKPGVKHCIVLGESAEAIARAITGVAPTSRVSSLAEGVALAADLSIPGDVVLFSPACASFDMFRDYRDRGQQFRDLVNALAD